LNRPKAKGKADKAREDKGSEEKAGAKVEKAKQRAGKKSAVKTRKKAMARKQDGVGAAGKKDSPQKPKRPGSKRAARQKENGVESTADGEQRKITPSAAGGQSEPAGRVEPADPFEVAKQKMKGSMPAIVDAMVKLAKKGSCSHAKTLLEMTGAKHMFDEAEGQESSEPWAKLVLERLDEAESKAGPVSVPEGTGEVGARA